MESNARYDGSGSSCRGASCGCAAAPTGQVLPGVLQESDFESRASTSLSSWPTEVQG
ncbi:MAG: hypothetical protein ACKVOM_05350 [Ferruginibacter sp.]